MAEVGAPAHHAVGAPLRPARVVGRAHARSSPGRTSRRPTPRRCPSSRGGRSRSAGTRRPAPCRRTRPRSCSRPGNVALEDVHAVLAAGLELGAPGEGLPREAAARRVLPLGLGGKAPAGPRAEGHGVVPRHVHDRVVRAAGDRRTAAPRGGASRLRRPAATRARGPPRASPGSRPGAAPRRRTTSRSARRRSRGRWPARTPRSARW